MGDTWQTPLNAAVKFIESHVGLEDSHLDTGKMRGEILAFLFVLRSRMDNGISNDARCLRRGGAQGGKSLTPCGQMAKGKKKSN